MLTQVFTQSLEEPCAPLNCAWCMKEQGIPFGEGSHGICTRHADIARRSAKQRRRAKMLAALQEAMLSVPSYVERNRGVAHFTPI